MNEQQKTTWDCSYCIEKKLSKPRNCGGAYAESLIHITRKTYFTQCPISLLNSFSTSVYELVNMSFNGMGGAGKITDLLELPNIWFEYKGIISAAEHQFEVENER